MEVPFQLPVALVTDGGTRRKPNDEGFVERIKCFGLQDWYVTRLAFEVHCDKVRP